MDPTSPPESAPGMWHRQVRDDVFVPMECCLMVKTRPVGQHEPSLLLPLIKCLIPYTAEVTSHINLINKRDPLLFQRLNVIISPHFIDPHGHEGRLRPPTIRRWGFSTIAAVPSRGGR